MTNLSLISSLFALSSFGISFSFSSLSSLFSLLISFISIFSFIFPSDLFNSTSVWFLSILLNSVIFFPKISILSLGFFSIMSLPSFCFSLFSIGSSFDIIFNTFVNSIGLTSSFLSSSLFSSGIFLLISKFSNFLVLFFFFFLLTFLSSSFFGLSSSLFSSLNDTLCTLLSDNSFSF